jgi:hypothetical protein
MAEPAAYFTTDVNFLIANPGIDVAGYATGAAFLASPENLIYYLDANGANPANYGNAASGSKIQNFFVDGDPNTYYVISPWKVDTNQYSVAVWQFTSEANLNDKILSIPKENGTLAFTSTDNWEQGNPPSIGNVLTNRSSSFLMNGEGTFMYNPLVP